MQHNGLPRPEIFYFEQRLTLLFLAITSVVPSVDPAATKPKPSCWLPMAPLSIDSKQIPVDHADFTNLFVQIATGTFNTSRHATALSILLSQRDTRFFTMTALVVGNQLGQSILVFYIDISYCAANFLKTQ